MSVVEQAQRLITEAVEAALEETYHLVHIHQGDELSRDQADGLVDNDDVDWDDWEWIYDVQRDGAEWELNEILRCVETALWRGHPEFEWDLHIEDWRNGPQWEEFLFAIEERDVSNPIRDLANQTQVALRIPLRDTALGDVLPRRLLNALSYNGYEAVFVFFVVSGFLIASLHQAGLATLTHTPAPMNFLNELCGRPDNEKALILLVVGYPAEGCVVPAIGKKPLEEIASFL